MEEGPDVLAVHDEKPYLQLVLKENSLELALLLLQLLNELLELVISVVPVQFLSHLLGNLVNQFGESLDLILKYFRQNEKLLEIVLEQFLVMCQMLIVLDEDCQSVGFSS